MTTRIDHPQWTIRPDSELEAEPSHIEIIEYDERNKNWFISSTYFAGVSYGYRIIQKEPNRFVIVDAWRSDDTKDNQDIESIPQSDIDWFRISLKKTIDEIERPLP